MSIKLEAFFKIPTQYLEYTVEKNICDNGHFVKRNDCYCSVCGKKNNYKICSINVTIIYIRYTCG